MLLLEAMKGTEVAALGRFVLRGKEHFSLIRARGDALVLETLFIAEDVNSQAEIEEAVADTEVKEAGARARAPGDREPRGDFEPEELQSEYRRDLRAMLEAKLAGEEIARPEPAAEDAPVVDLMEALRQSVEEVSKKGSGARRPPRRRRRLARRRRPPPEKARGPVNRSRRCGRGSRSGRLRAVAVADPRGGSAIAQMAQ